MSCRVLDDHIIVSCIACCSRNLSSFAGIVVFGAWRKTCIYQGKQRPLKKFSQYGTCLGLQFAAAGGV